MKNTDNEFKTVFGGIGGYTADRFLADPQTEKFCLYEVFIESVNQNLVFLGTQVNQFYSLDEVNQYGFYYQVLPKIAFQTDLTESLELYEGQEDTTVVIKSLDFYPDGDFPDIVQENFPINYYVISDLDYTNDPGPTVSIINDSEISISNMAVVALGSY